jgi:hypothetical protein
MRIIYTQQWDPAVAFKNIVSPCQPTFSQPTETIVITCPVRLASCLEYSAASNPGHGLPWMTYWNIYGKIFGPSDLHWLTSSNRTLAEWAARMAHCIIFPS